MIDGHESFTQVRSKMVDFVKSAVSVKKIDTNFWSLQESSIPS